MDLDEADRFARVRALGEGASGRVFEVFDRLHSARFALKQLRTDRALDAHRIASFKDEFRSVARVAHRNLAKVYELLIFGSDVYVLMELIDGVDFIRHVRFGCDDVPSLATQSEQDAAVAAEPGGQLSVPRLRAALRQLASGILALHASGRIHCDLKPENILVEETGRVVIVDFGLIASQSIPRTARLRGTPQYMAPEHMDGAASEASDWYAFGVILYIALTGRVPFSGLASSMQYDKRFVKLVDPRLLDSKLPHDLCDLCLRLLCPDPSKRPSGEQIVQLLALEMAEVAETALARPVVGRSLHLAALETALDEVRAGTARVVFVHGESGIGKTTLLSHFLDKVRSEDRRALTFRGTCYRDASVPYKGLDSVMDYVAADSTRRERGLSRVDVAALATMFPVFRHLAPTTPGLGDLHPFELRKRALGAVRALFEDLASQATTVLAIDDFQWADEDTVHVLAEVLREPAAPPLLVVLGHRSPSDREEGLVVRARAELPCHCDVPLGPLEREDVRSMVSAMLKRDLGDRELDQIANDCTGNPFLLHQLVAARAAHSRAHTLDEVVEHRTQRLSPTQRTYVELVALAGRPIDERVLAKIVGAPGSELMAARHELTAACFVRSAETHPNGVESYHDQIRERLLRAIPPHRARRHHARLGAELEATSGADPEVLARHFRAAGERAKAALYSERAGDSAMQTLAFERAVALYGAASELAGSEAADRLRLRQADALSNAGRALEAADVFLAVSARRPGDIELRLLAGDELLRAGQLDRGFELLQRVARRLNERIPQHDVLTQLALVWNGWRLPRRPISKPTRRSVTVAQQHRLNACVTLARRLAMVDTPAAALFQRRYLRLAHEFGSAVDIARGLALEASFSAHMPQFAPGGPARATRLIARCRAFLADHDHPDIRSIALFAEAMVAYANGQWRECREGMERAVEVMQREVVRGVRWDVALGQSFIGYMLWLEGDIPAIRRNIQEYMAGAAGHLSLESTIAQRVGVMLLLCDDEPAQARRLALEMMARWPPGRWRLQHYLDAFAQVEIDLYEGRTEDAWERVTNSWSKSAKAGIFQQKLFVPFSHAQRTRVALKAGKPEWAQYDIRALESSPAPWASGLGRLFRASARMAEGDPNGARYLLESAANAMNTWELRLFELAARWRLGQLTEPELTAQAARELSALGVRRPERMVDVLLPWATTTAT